MITSSLEFEATIFFKYLETAHPINTPKRNKMKKSLIQMFLYLLAGNEGCQFNGVEWRCGGPEFTYARKVLNMMKVPPEKQDEFIEKCKLLGGYCDCEILRD